MNDFSGMGQHVDELLVGIVMLIRLRETETEPNIRQKHSLAQKIFHFMMVVVLFQLIFLNKTNYSSCRRDLSPYRPFQELHNIQMLTAHY